MHTSLEVSYCGHALMLDCGADWLHRIRRMRPEAIVLTHAHPDHAWGLKKGSPCPVYATSDTWRSLGNFPISGRVLIQARSSFQIHGIKLEAFPVAHSIRAPAVGYRITAGRSSIFYVPDLVYIYDRHEALSGIRLYIGDGAALRRPIVRKRNGSLVGHAAVRTQLSWCAGEGVKNVVITHCGSQIVGMDSRIANRLVSDLGHKWGVLAQIAFDGLEIALP